MTTVVFVHGNPDVDIIWEPLARSLAREGWTDQVRLSPPGFGAPVPDGFEATPVGYRGWLVAALEDIGEPVHLVGHDWGGGHVVSVAMARPDLLRSWVSDTIGIFHPDYEWHPHAAVWQSSPEGEQWVAEQIANPTALAGLLLEHGMHEAMAVDVAARFDETMGSCILELYRASAQPAMARLGKDLPAAKGSPGLVLVATEDHAVGTEEQRRQAGEMAGAQVVTLRDAKHWWMTVDHPVGTAAVASFWREVEGAG